MQGDQPLSTSGKSPGAPLDVWKAFVVEIEAWRVDGFLKPV